MRFTSVRVDPLVDVGLYGTAILAAGFMLSWGAETAEKLVAQGLIVAVLALITVLPEYAVDIYYALQAGRNPQSQYVHYAAANMTGANRLLIGAAWPLMLLLFWWRTGKQSIELPPQNSIEVFFLPLPTFYSFVILIRNRIDLLNAAILVSMFGLYIWRVTRLPKRNDQDEEDAGPAAAIARLSARTQWIIITALVGGAAAVILIVAEPFAESLIAAGRLWGFSEFFLIQWLAPLANEMPAITLAALFVLGGRASTALGTMLSDKINQWTLLVGMLPLAISLSARQVLGLPLDARQHEELFLTSAQSLFGVVVLLRLRLAVPGALALATLFITQIALAFIHRNNEPEIITLLTALGWLYLGCAAVIFALRLPLLRTTLKNI